MTGITSVSEESIFLDLNNLEVVTTTSDKYADYFGFTEEEVFQALDERNLSDCKQDVKDWYDGFTFGSRTDIYNPWSIINYMDKKKVDTYWAATSANSLAGKLIKEGTPDGKIVMEDLLKGGIFHTIIDEQIVFNQLNHRKGAVWSLLLASGYLKVKHFEFNEKSGKLEFDLKLTNMEVRIMFEQMIGDWFSEYTPYYNEFIKAMLRDDKKEMNIYMNKVALTTFCFFDTGTRPSANAESERFYHGFVLGLMVDLADRYIITSNRESGFGRYDVMLEPLNSGDDAMILEFKVYDPEDEKTLQDTVKATLQQIEDKHYAAAL